jgi:hypothetical protein
MLKTRLMAPPMLDRFPHALMKPNTGCAYAHTGLLVAPDWLLGALFGIGGFLGMYCGARLQKYFSARFIKLILVLAILFHDVSYLLGFFRLHKRHGCARLLEAITKGT